jgi:hypothetical protein
MDISSYITHYLTSPVSSLYMQLQLGLLKKPINKSVIQSKKSQFVSRLELYRSYLEALKANEQHSLFEIPVNRLHPSIHDTTTISVLQKDIALNILNIYQILHPECEFTIQKQQNKILCSIKSEITHTDDSRFEHWLLTEIITLITPKDSTETTHIFAIEIN